MRNYLLNFIFLILNKMKKVIKKNKPKSFFEQIKMLNKKTKRDTKEAKPKTEAEQNELTRVANELRKRDNLSLEDIKDALKNNTKLKATDAKIIDTILKCKMKEDKILLKDDTFAKQLSFYIVGRDIKTKYLTNDYLYLNMIASRFVFPDQDSNVSLPLLLNGAVLQNVTIVSQNFNVTTDTTKGLIQDYDGTFSLICSKETQSSDLIEQIITQKPSAGTFDLNGSVYEYYGNEEACIIQVPGLGVDEVREKVKNMKFVHNENSVFVNGEKKVTADGKMKFISKKVFPESFCPSFWASPEPILCDFLFEFSLDYNVLFEYLEKYKGDELIIPPNICYWDNIKYFFDFLGVFYLTARDLPFDKATNIGNHVTAFKSVRDFCTAWKSQALNVQRVFQDFINSFLNNSSFSRFTFLYEKALTVHKSITELMKKQEFNNFCNVLKKFKTFFYINNQLERIKDVVVVLSGIISCLKKYCEGSNNPDALWREIASVANKILLYLPNITEERDALFPFICSEGGFNDNVSSNKENATLLAVKRNMRRKIKEKEQNAMLVKSVSEASSTVTKEMKKYLQGHIRGRTENISSAVENALVEALYEYFMWSDKVQKERERFIGYLTYTYSKLGRPLEALIDEMARVFIARTNNVNLAVKDERVKDFIDKNEGKISMVMSNFTFNPNKNKGKIEDKKVKKEEKKKNDENEEEEEEEEDEKNDK